LPAAGEKLPRLIYNDDGNSVVFLPHRVPMTAPQLTDLIDQFRGTQVDRYVFCLGNGRVALHDSRVADRAWVRAGGTYRSHVDYRFSENARHLVESGSDPPRALREAARKAGLEYWLSLRMNDAHFAYSREGPDQSLWAGAFWHAHPEVRLGGEGYQRHLFDYSHRAVRDFRLNYIREAIAKYQPDGFELDFLRHPFFFPAGEGRKRASIMTEFVADVGKILNAGVRRTPLGVLVPRTLHAGLDAGLDVAAWVKSKIVDWIVPKHYIRFNMDVPAEEFLHLAAGTGIRVAPCLEQRVDVTDEQFRAAASRYWRAGVDSIYLYNFFNHRPHPLCQQDRAILSEIGDRAAIQLRDKRYFVLPSSTSDIADEPKQIPVKLEPGSDGVAIAMHVGDDFEKAAAFKALARLTLRLGVPELTPEGDEWEIRVNGEMAAAGQQRSEADADAFSERWIEVDLTAGPWPRAGRNEIRFILKKRNPGIRKDLQLTDVELVVRYR
jgi:hypothetical protein